MRFVPLVVLVLLATAIPARPESTVPTEAEIESAYRTKPKTNKVRNWSLKFKRLARSHEFGFLTHRYRITARKDRTCVEYRLTERTPVPPTPVEVKPIVVIDRGAEESCR